MSASEWPSNPKSEAMTTPPRISGRPRTMRWTSQPWPIRKLKTRSLRSNSGRHFLRQKQPRQVHVGRLGDLQIAIAARDHAHFHLIQAFHQAGFVGAGETILARLRE